MYYVNVYKKHQLHVNTCMIHNRRRAPATPQSQPRRSRAGEQPQTHNSRTTPTTASSHQHRRTEQIRTTSRARDTETQQDTPRRPTSRRATAGQRPAPPPAERRKAESRKKGRNREPETLNKYVICVLLTP